MGCHPPLIIVGASVRAAAQSAIRAGFTPWCADQFADEDLRACAQLLPLSGYPNGIAAALQAAPYAPWIYTGGLENHPDLVEELSRIRPLFGNYHEMLRHVRDPFWLAQTLTSRGLPCLKVATQINADTANIQWLSKPLAGAGGIGIEHHDPSRCGVPPGCYLQEYATGPGVAGLFLGTLQGSLLLGLSRQLSSESAIAGRPFAYVGSIAPLSQTDIPQTCFDQAAEIGAAVAEASELRGLFGIDFVFVEEREQLLTLEINPRYPASAELYELAGNWPLLRWHVDVCSSNDSATAHIAAKIRETPATARCFGKRVLYASRDLIAPDLRIIDSSAQNTWLADIPTPGSVIPAGMPVCTVMASAPSAAACEETLRSWAAIAT